MRSSPPPLPAHAQQGSVASTLRALAAGTRPSDVWRSAAFALLRLNPKECEALALVFEDETVVDDTRLLVLDLLAGAGSFEAQVVIRRLLALSVARRDNRMFATFVQRLGIVEAPDGPTLRFLMSVYAESRAEPQDVRAACAYALGAAAGQSFSSGDPDAAVRASDVLRRDLLSATAVPEKCALLTALGNAGVTSDIMVITRFTQDADAPVRSAAALALRKLNVADARAHLIQLVGDSEPKVAQSALAALSEHKLDDEELGRLSDQVLGGHTPIGLDMQILRLIVAQRPRLTSIPGQACAIENALRLLLGRVEAAGSNEPNTATGSGERRAVFPQPRKFPSVTSADGSLPAMIAAARFDLTPIPAPPTPMSATPPHTPPQTPYVQHAPLEPVTQRNDGATVVDMPPIASGAYRLVNEFIEKRARIAELGLDPDGRSTSIPQPPPRRASSHHMAVAPPAVMPIAPPPAGVPSRAKTRINPNAIVRGRGRGGN
jgi:hypothetical protein